MNWNSMTTVAKTIRSHPKNDKYGQIYESLKGVHRSVFLQTFAPLFDQHLAKTAAIQEMPEVESSGFVWQTDRKSLSVNLAVRSAISPIKPQRGRYGQRYATLFTRAESGRTEEITASA
jgi:hypothetical protein